MFFDKSIFNSVVTVRVLVHALFLISLSPLMDLLVEKVVGVHLGRPLKFLKWRIRPVIILPKKLGRLMISFNFKTCSLPHS